MDGIRWGEEEEEENRADALTSSRFNELAASTTCINFQVESRHCTCPQLLARHLKIANQLEGCLGIDAGEVARYPPFVSELHERLSGTSSWADRLHAPDDLVAADFRKMESLIV